MKLTTRSRKAKFNTLTSLVYQLVTIVCGLVTPRLLLSTFGSEAYGATTSIIQFLSYITLIEGGIGGVARAALYKPLAEENRERISNIYFAVKKFFNIVGVVFLVYTIIIAFAYHDISGIVVWDRSFTFMLVMAISISTMGQYFFGIANLTLLNADQKQYINNILSIVTTIINTLMIILLVNLDCNILIVKLCSSCIFILRPVLFMLLVRKNYNLKKPVRIDSSALSQKWTGLGQHIAFFLHTNTDVVLLTMFANLKMVSIYSIYNMVVTSIRSIARSFSVGMEAVFGDMIARNEKESLQKAYSYYEKLLSTFSVILFSTASILIVSFVKLYTKSISDANYIQPLFGQILLMAEAIDCIMIPCCSMPIAANRFRDTRIGAYGEAIVNIVLSFILIWWNPLLGVAIGTLMAVLFKVIYYMIYASKHILHISLKRIVDRLFINVLMMIGIIALGSYLVESITLTTVVAWIICAGITFVCVSILVMFINLIIYTKEYKQFLISLVNKTDSF